VVGPLGPATGFGLGQRGDLAERAAKPPGHPGGIVVLGLHPPGTHLDPDGVTVNLDLVKGSGRQPP
jgi:hypothetical protein